MSLLTTFWVSPFGYLKLSLACFPLVISTVVLLTLGILIPIHSQQVPNLGKLLHHEVAIKVNFLLQFYYTATV